MGVVEEPVWRADLVERARRLAASAERLGSACRRSVQPPDDAVVGEVDELADAAWRVYRLLGGDDDGELSPP